MGNSGTNFISIIFGIIIIAVLTVMVMRTVGVRDPDTGEEITPEGAIDKAKVTECIVKLQDINTQIRMFQVENDRLPESLDEVTSDYYCPVSGVEYQYDEQTRKAWCPEHS